MKLSHLLLCSATALAQVSLKFDILRGPDYHSAEKTPASQRRFVKRNGIVVAGLVNEETYYNAQVVIDGTEFNVLVDTGSSDLWVYGSDNPYCISNVGKGSKVRKFEASPEDLEKARLIDASPDFLSTPTEPQLDKRDSLSSSIPSASATIDCAAYGTFDTSTQAWKTHNQTFFIQYGDLTYALGTWGSSVVSFGNATLENFTFGVANNSNSTVPVFGLGFEGNEASTASFMENYGGAFQYANFPAALKEAGFIERTLYSLYMNSETSEGSVLFGGIDHAKYTGDLVTLPLDNIYADKGYEQPITFNVQLSSLTLTSSGGDVNAISSPVSVLLDSGTSFVYLPENAVNTMMQAFGAVYSNDIGFYVIDCPTGSTGVEFNFQFGDVNISIPFEDFLTTADETGTLCAILINTSEDVILGDTFLERAYVVYDLDGLQVQLAPVNNTDVEDIEVIGSQGPTASDGATASSQLTDTVSGFVSAGPSQTITQAISQSIASDSFASGRSTAVSETHFTGATTVTRTGASTSTSATASASGSATSSKNAGYKLEGLGLGILAMMLL
jgi:yapsin 1